jgi:hypothetical protein
VINNENSLDRRHGGLSGIELIRIAAFLEEAADEFTDHGCNDFTEPVTPENKTIFKEIVNWQTDQDWGDDNPQWLSDVENANAESKPA